uniref:Uncharacterized protein n=1 Tax=Arundo donax TaxID=35708 RepID=A0A0A9DTC8_ARUDO
MYLFLKRYCHTPSLLISLKSHLLKPRLQQRIFMGKTKETQNGGKELDWSVWNGGNFHPFPLEYCSKILNSQERKNPLPSLVFSSFA